MAEATAEQQRAATMAYLRSLGPDGACQVIEKAISGALAQQQPRDVPALIALMCLFDPHRAEHVRRLLVDAAQGRTTQESP